MHKKEGYIFAQLWHVGRVSLISQIGKQPVSSSNLVIDGTTRNNNGEHVPYDVPRALEISEIKDILFNH